MSNEESILQRRRLLRGGALLAGAAAGAVAVSAAGATRAEAADGDQVTVGNDHSGTDTTTLTIDNQQAPTLGLANGNGPSLRLSPLADNWEGGLDAGEIANTYAGPLIGVSDGPSAPSIATYLATGVDLAALPLPVAYESPDRALDTRSASGRGRVVATSSSPYTTGSRLKAGAWLDVLIGMGDGDFTLEGAFLNVTSIDSLGGGFLATYRPGPRPQVATTRFAKGVTATSSAFMALGVVNGDFAIRVYTSAATHVIIDVTGVTATALPGPIASAQAKRQPVRRGRAAVNPQRLMRRRTTR